MFVSALLDIYVCACTYLHIVQDKWTPLQCAVRNGYVKVVEALIRSGADVNANNMVHWHKAMQHVVYLLCRKSGHLCILQPGMVTLQ